MPCVRRFFPFVVFDELKPSGFNSEQRTRPKGNRQPVLLKGADW